MANTQHVKATGLQVCIKHEILSRMIFNMLKERFFVFFYFLLPLNPVWQKEHVNWLTSLHTSYYYMQDKQLHEEFLSVGGAEAHRTERINQLHPLDFTVTSYFTSSRNLCILHPQWLLWFPLTIRRARQWWNHVKTWRLLNLIWRKTMWRRQRKFFFLLSFDLQKSLNQKNCNYRFAISGWQRTCVYIPAAWRVNILFFLSFLQQ